MTVDFASLAGELEGARQSHVLQSHPRSCPALSFPPVPDPTGPRRTAVGTPFFLNTQGRKQGGNGAAMCPASPWGALQTSVTKFLLFIFVLTLKTAYINCEQPHGEVDKIPWLHSMADEIAARYGATKDRGDTWPEIQPQARHVGLAGPGLTRKEVTVFSKVKLD